MSEVGIQTTPTQTPLPPKEAPSPAPRGGGGRRPTPLWLQFFKVLASLRLTVVLFVLSMLLVFFGTVAQMDQGLFTVLHSFFRCFLAWIPFQVFLRFGQVFFGLPTTWEVSGTFPFPGGYTLGLLLLLNLIAAHAVRFRPFRRVRVRPEAGAEGEPKSLGLGSGKLQFEWKKTGILLIHSGLVIMLLGEAVTGFFAVESTMTLAENESVNFVDVSNSVELAITDPSDPEVNHVVTIPGKMLQEGKVLSHEALPFDIQVQERWDNSNLVQVRGMAGEDTRDVFFTKRGSFWRVTPQGEERGVDAAREDAVSARLVFRPKEGKGEPATQLLSMWFYKNYTRRSLVFPPQYVTAGGKAYRVELRPKRVYKPYTVQLIKFTHATFQGTDTPKDFASDVRVTDPEEKEDRTVHIWMNHPLFYRGETFYQAGYLPTDVPGTPRGTVLQVVRNPGWVMPYLSCVMVALGMIIHFGVNLKKFQERRAAS
jgi:hypothetical protein